MPKLPSVRPADNLIAALRRALAEGTWPVGSWLPPEIELARRFAVSRTALRVALAALVAEGLLTTRAGRGTRVVSGVDRMDRSVHLLHNLHPAELERVRALADTQGLLLHVASQIDAAWNPTAEAALLDLIDSECPRGLILAANPLAAHAERLQRLAARGTRVILVEPAHVGDLPSEYALLDYHGAGSAAAVELLLGGCRHLRFLAMGQAPYECELERGFLAATHRHAGPLPERRTAEPGLEDHRSGAWERFLAWLRRLPEGTGIFARSADLAEAVMAGAQQLGRHVPGELSLIAFDLVFANTPVRQSFDRLVFDRAALVESALRALADPAAGVLRSRQMPSVARAGSTARRRT